MLAYNVYLIGFMGTGKSTVASYFGKKHVVDVIEMDEAIAKREKKSITDIFAENGERYFRDLETSFLKELDAKKNLIVSCGGGVILREENVQLMKKNGKIVLLTASPEVICERVKNDNGRPLLKGRKNPEAIKMLMDERQKKYEEAADITISTDGKSADEICEEIMNEIKRAKERE